MDVNELLARMRELSKEAREGQDARHNERELRWAFDDLDEWLSRGGFLPTPWAR